MDLKPTLEGRDMHFAFSPNISAFELRTTQFLTGDISRLSAYLSTLRFFTQIQIPLDVSTVSFSIYLRP